jgi:hypothetical protein
MPRSKSWGFPRWGGHGRAEELTEVRLCDWPNCTARGECPAPKSRHSKERWMFCEEHAAQYNRAWNYFAGMSDAEAQEAAAEDAREARGYKQSRTWDWAETTTREDREREAAFEVLGLDETATEDEIKSRYRRLAKENHPDRNPGDEAAQQRFIRITAAYETLRSKAG